MISVQESHPSDYLLVQGDAGRIPLSDKSVSLVFGSPPYTDARLYLEGGRDLGISRGCREWVEWMLGITAEAMRVSIGPVVWVAAGVTRDRCYWPACEGLMWEWWKRGGECQLYRPCYWNRVGVPGSGHSDWFRHDTEYVMCFKRPGKLPWSDNTAMGHPPKYNNEGGSPSYRLVNGNRVRTYKRGRRPNGRKIQVEPSGGAAGTTISVELANPGNLIHTKAGGGHLGHNLAHESEAPFPEFLAEWFVRSLCPPGGTVLDPFSGSATTAAVARLLGRRAIGLDLRRSQCELGGRRVREQTLDWERPHRAKPSRRGKATAAGPTLFCDHE